eukprot:13917951-Alexandrium_andersonii.AAC.1
MHMRKRRTGMPQAPTQVCASTIARAIGGAIMSRPCHPPSPSAFIMSIAIDIATTLAIVGQ